MSTFRRRQMQASQAVDSGDGVFLPTTYQRVEYIQGNGSAYIDLGVKNKTTFGCLVDVGGEFVSGASDGSVAGIGIRHSFDYHSVVYIAYPRSEAEYYNANIGLRNVVKSNYLGSGIGEVEGIPESQMSISSYVGNTDFSFLLFGYHVYNGEVWNIKNGKLYHFQLTDGQDIIMDLWPCYRKNDNTPGLYDIVTKQFFSNAAQSGAFTVGPDIIVKSPYIQFVDPVVEKICATNWGDGIGITKAQASAVASINGVFENNTQITSFNEFQYFTNVGNLYYNAFSGCTSLNEITLPDSPNLYLSDHRALQVRHELIINLPSINTWFNLARVVNNPNWPYADSSTYFDVRIDGERVTSVTVPADVIASGTSLGGVFSNWKYLKNVVVANNATVIGGNAFSYCLSLETISLPSTIEVIGVGAFTNAGTDANNKKQNVLSLPNLQSIGCSFDNCYLFREYNDLGRITTIPSLAFYGAKYDLLIIPTTVTSVGQDRALCTWGSSYIVVSKAQTAPSIDASGNILWGAISAIYVPYSADHSILDAYKAASGWSTYASQIYELNPDGTIPTS